MGDSKPDQSRLDLWLLILQLLSAVVFIGAAAIGVWNAIVVVRSQRKWYAKTWAVLLGLCTSSCSGLRWSSISLRSTRTTEARRVDICWSTLRCDGSRAAFPAAAARVADASEVGVQVQLVVHAFSVVKAWPRAFSRSMTLPCRMTFSICAHARTFRADWPPATAGWPPCRSRPCRSPCRDGTGAHC